MSVDRKDREDETRESTMRVKAWKQPGEMPEIKKQTGYFYKWVRVSYGDKPDTRNMVSHRTQGFEAVRIEEQKHLADLVDSSSRFKDNIEYDGLLLMKQPLELRKQRNAFYAKQNDAQLASVDSNFMKESDSRMPLFKEARSKVSFGKGN